jgi:hypothetical protein
MGLCARLKALFHRRSCCATCDCDGGASWDGHDGGSWGAGHAAPHISGAPGHISSMPLTGGAMGGSMGTIISPSTPGTMPSAGEQIKAPRDAGTGEKMPAGTREDKGKQPREDKGKEEGKEARTEPLPEITPATPAFTAPRPADTDVKTSPF